MVAAADGLFDGSEITLEIVALLVKIDWWHKSLAQRLHIHWQSTATALEGDPSDRHRLLLCRNILAPPAPGRQGPFCRAPANGARDHPRSLAPSRTATGSRSRRERCLFVDYLSANWRMRAILVLSISRCRHGDSVGIFSKPCHCWQGFLHRFLIHIRMVPLLGAL